MVSNRAAHEPLFIVEAALSCQELEIAIAYDWARLRAAVQPGGAWREVAIGFAASQLAAGIAVAPGIVR